MPSLQLKVPLPDGLSLMIPHTIVRDDQGNLYLSDEFNHKMVSLDRSGALRWQAGGKGSGECQFFYPRGIALGWILIKDKRRKCLAVCDAWNNRLQFLDLNGTYLGSWHAAGGREFQEVCDVRYLVNSGTGGMGCWCVLDRSNHRLCALGDDGQMHLGIGRAFPPDLEPQWNKPVFGFPDFDPLFYPTKILGQSERALYLFEPLANRLKQAWFGSLFPLYIRPPRGGEWIAAADDAFLAWNRTDQRLSWLDGFGNILVEDCVQGIPVSADMDAGEVWLHFSGHLELWRFEALEPLAVGRESKELFPALIGAANEEMASVDLASVSRNLSAALSSCLEVCDEFLQAVCAGNRDAAAIESTHARALACWRSTEATRGPSAEQVHKLWLLSFKLRILALSCNHPETQLRLQNLRASFDRAIKLMTDGITGAVLRRDQAILVRLNLQRTLRHIDMPAISGLATLIEFQLSVIKVLLLWCRAQFRRTDLPAAAPESTGGLASADFPVRWIFSPHTRSDRQALRLLGESARFDVLPPDTEGPANPLCAVQMATGDYFVTLFSRGTIAHLDADGKFMEEIFGTASSCGTLSRPAGLAVDRQDRLWIVEQLRRSVRLYDPRSGKAGDVVPPSTSSDGLVSPVGIAEGPSGTMLVADLGGNRILALRDTGSMVVFCDRAGAGPGEFRCPVSLCASAPDADSGIWIVDQRNHRLQKLDGSARFVQQIGKCGPGRDSFLAPWFAAQFPDGIVAVSQSEIEPCLKLFSPKGEELDCLFLDYVPAGLLVSDGRLMVAEWNGRSIRVYERTR